MVKIFCSYLYPIFQYGGRNLEEWLEKSVKIWCPMICSHYGQYLRQNNISGSPDHGIYTLCYMATVGNKYLAHKLKMAAAKPEIPVIHNADEMEKKSWWLNHRFFAHISATRANFFMRFGSFPRMSSSASKDGNGIEKVQVDTTWRHRKRGWGRWIFVWKRIEFDSSQSLFVNHQQSLG